MSDTKLPEVVETEISRFRENIQRLRSGEMDPDEFKKFRLNNGIYGIRGEKEKQMVRIKVPYGVLSAEQLEALADIADRFAPLKSGHITTRQAVQMHRISLDDCPELIRQVNASGLTTREACGNTVRNITCCPYSGVSPEEVFDVAPYADAVFRYFLRNPINQNLPRKFKFAFESCPTDHILTAIHDIGLVAAVKKEAGRIRKGFRIYLGGGLGALPFVAQKLEEFTPVENLIPTAEAILRLFDRLGERKDKNHARLKFVVKRFGFEEFKKMVLQERSQVSATRAGDRNWNFSEPIPESPPAEPKNIPIVKTPEEGFERWKATNALTQKQPGYSLVTIVCPLGDITSVQMRALAGIARRYCGGRLRTAIEQNMVMRWVRNQDLAALHAELRAAELATAGALRFSDITRCPGADTCQIAVTKSRGLAQALGELFKNGLSSQADLKGLHVKISGCTNSCGQHHIGTLGFYGTYRKIDNRQVPHYQLLVGGSTREGEARFGQPILALPARRVPEAVKKLIELYQHERQHNEDFLAVMGRLGKDRLKTELAPYAALPPYEQNPQMYFEWGENKDFVADIGQGECAS
jgi:sulfite reductase (ferredoxin)